MSHNCNTNCVNKCSRFVQGLLRKKQLIKQILGDKTQLIMPFTTIHLATLNSVGFQNINKADLYGDLQEVLLRWKRVVIESTIVVKIGNVTVNPLEHHAGEE